MQEATIRELGEKMASGEETSRSLAEAFLRRIESVDRSGPAINTVIELNPDALSIADKRDRERGDGKVRGPLHGVPVLIKDNIDTRDRMQTTAGSLALEGSHARRDAFIVKRLRAAGAVLLGKTNLSEWANFRGEHSVSGWSSRGGLTRNPYALDRTACGSSSGSAAAVAANLCAASIGTETDGSIICPAHTCGVVGLKPTLGLLSRSGIIPIAHSQDTAGPFGRAVEDVAILLGALAGVDERDKTTLLKRRRAHRDYTTFLDEEGISGVRIGVPRNLLETNERMLEILETSLEVLRDLGAEIVDPADLPNYDAFHEAELEVLLYEFKHGLNAYLGTSGPRAKVHSVDELIKFNEENKERVMPFFGQELLLAAREKGSLSSPEYRKALSTCRRMTRKEGIDAVINSKRLDAMVSLSGLPASLIDLANGDPDRWELGCIGPTAVAGYPHLTVPGGYLFGLPIGISFFSKAWREPTLLRIGYAFEQALKARKPPQFQPTVEFEV